MLLRLVPLNLHRLSQQPKIQKALMTQMNPSDHLEPFQPIVSPDILQMILQHRLDLLVITDLLEVHVITADTVLFAFPLQGVFVRDNNRYKATFQ